MCTSITGPSNVLSASMIAIEVCVKAPGLIAIPPAILAPAILVVASLGVLAAGGKPFDVVSLAAFGLFGYAARRGGFPLMPLLMGFVIAAPFEDHVRRAITHARGDWLVVATEPGVLALSALIIAAAFGLRRLKPRQAPAGG